MHRAEPVLLKISNKFNEGGIVRKRKIVLLFASCAAVAFAVLPCSSQEVRPAVKIVYIVPADRVIRPEYARNVANAARNVRIWYLQQVGGGRTFHLDSPAVSVVRSTHLADWYATNPIGNEPALWFWYNAIADTFALTGAAFDDPNHRWVLYLDADMACGQIAGSAAGVALLPANDLRGLAGELNLPACPEEAPDMGGVGRWRGGLAQELGQTFGLVQRVQPSPCPGGTDDAALMCLGYIQYPQTFLLARDKSILASSPFFLPRPQAPPQP
jgi:hypothetical protein